MSNEMTQEAQGAPVDVIDQLKEIEAAEIAAKSGEAPSEEPAPAGEVSEENLLLGRFPNNEKGVGDLVEHARHFQSEADRQRVRADQLETRMMELETAIKGKPEEAAPAPEPIAPPDFFDVTDVGNPTTESGKWFNNMIARRAESAVEPYLKKMEEVQKAQTFLAQHPELTDTNLRDEFQNFVASKMRDGGVSHEDLYQLMLAKKGMTPGANTGQPQAAPEATIPTGVGGTPSKAPSLTPEEREALAIIRAGDLPGVRDFG